MADLSIFVAVGIAVVVVGIVLIIAAVIRASMGTKRGGGRLRGAGVIMIGPIPIIFGTDKKSVKVVLALALALTIALLIFFVVSYWFLR